MTFALEDTVCWFPAVAALLHEQHVGAGHLLVVPGDDAGEVGCCAVADLYCFAVEIFCEL